MRDLILGAARKFASGATNSPKTTAAGVFGFLAILFLTLQHQFDAESATVADWKSVLLAGSVALVAIFGRDNDVSSEEAGRD